MTDTTSTRLMLEQLAYNEIRHRLSELFLSDPVGFVQTYGRRPEDFLGQHLRDFYRTMDMNIQLQNECLTLFARKFRERKIFGESRTGVDIG